MHCPLGEIRIVKIWHWRPQGDHGHHLDLLPGTGEISRARPRHCGQSFSNPGGAPSVPQMPVAW
jgi:hypothetical protein